MSEASPAEPDSTASSLPPRPTPFHWQPWAWAGALLLLVVAVYWPTLQNGFIWDDESYIVGNTTLRSVQGLHDMWLKWGAIPQYYPLTHTTFWVEFHLWGFDPRGYHLDNMILHAAAAIMLWRLLLRLEVPGAWVAAAIYAVHPVCVETVAWASERKNVLSCALALGSILTFLRYAPPEESGDVEKPKKGWDYELALGLFIAALLSKTVTAAVPAVLLLIYWWKRGRVSQRLLYDLAPMFAFGVALGGVTVWLERAQVGAEGSDWNFSFPARVLIAGQAIVFYAGKIFWPHPLVFFYPQWTIDVGDFVQWLYPLAVLAALAVLWGVRGRIGRGPIAAALIFVGTLTPALGFLNVYPFRYSLVADHFQYHACIALIALAVAVAALAWRKLGAAAAWGGPMLAAAVIMALAIVAHQQTYVYRSLITLYTHVLAWNPQSWAAEINLAHHLDALGHLDEAKQRYQHGLELCGKSRWHLGDLNRAFELTGTIDEGIEQLTADLGNAEFDDREQGETHRRLADLLLIAKRYPDAAAHYRSALDIDPNNLKALGGLGVALAEQGELDEAVVVAEKAVSLHPSNARTQRLLGSLLRKQQKYPQAVAALAKALELNVADVRTREELAVALYEAGDIKQAATIAEQVLQVNQRSADCLNVIGAARLMQGDVVAARRFFETALTVEPGHAEALANLERAQRGPSSSAAQRPEAATGRPLSSPPMVVPAP